MDDFIKYLLPLFSLGGSIAAVVGGYFTLKGNVQSLEKRFDEQFSDNGRVGKLEKYATLHFDSIKTLNEGTILWKERMETMTRSFNDLHEKIDDHIQEDAKTSIVINQIFDIVKKGA